jgi:hypothetical protein
VFARAITHAPLLITNDRKLLIVEHWSASYPGNTPAILGHSLPPYSISHYVSYLHIVFIRNPKAIVSVEEQRGSGKKKVAGDPGPGEISEA